MDKVRKTSGPGHSKQWTTFFEKKILHDPTHKEIERQEKLLADDYEKKRLGCASTTEDLRHLKTTKLIDRNEKQVQRESYGVREYLLQPLRRVTSFSTGYYDVGTTPASNAQFVRNRLNRRPPRYKNLWSAGDPGIEWCEAVSEEQRESLEKCLQVQPMTLNQNVVQKDEDLV